MLSRIFTIAALLGVSMAAAAPSTRSLNLAILQARQAAEAPRLAAAGMVLDSTEALADGYFIETYTDIDDTTVPAVQHQNFVRPAYCHETLRCDYSPQHGVKREVTERLVRVLFRHKGWEWRAPRSMCLYGDYSRACVSWYVSACRVASRPESRETHT